VVGAATENERRPIVERRCAGTCKDIVVNERSRRRPGKSATRTRSSKYGGANPCSTRYASMETLKSMRSGMHSQWSVARHTTADVVLTTNLFTLILKLIYSKNLCLCLHLFQHSPFPCVGLIRFICSSVFMFLVLFLSGFRYWSRLGRHSVSTSSGQLFFLLLLCILVFDLTRTN